VESVRCYIDQTALKLQVQLINGAAHIPRKWEDILVSFCFFVVRACGLDDRTSPIKPMINTPQQLRSLVPMFYIASKGGGLWGENSCMNFTKAGVFPE
jgi:hypothetical protein